MKLIDIMNPWNGVKYLQDGVNGNFEINELKTDSEIFKGQIIEIVDNLNNKIGEIDKDILLYLISKSHSTMLSNIIDMFQDAVIAIDLEGRIFHLNTAYAKILGIPIRKVIGKKMQYVEPGAEILSVLETRKSISKDKQYIKTLDKYVSVKIYPIEEEGELKAVVSIFRDSTKMVKLGQEVKQANEMAMTYKREAEALNELSKLKIIGKSSIFLNTVSQALIVAKTEASVLIKGENGSGKELIAKLIHSNSERKNRPIIMVNCAAIPESLIESELFGYEEGSFTGAKSGGKMGKFELANGGTLFLDEIGDMPLAMQAKLLRVLQVGEIEKIGRQKNIPVDIRLIAATNQPLENMVKEKKFRQDLYFRLNIVEIDVPPLRDRGEDIGLLANYFLEKYNKKYKKSIFFSEKVLSFLHSYKWPGNVRELQNCTEYGVIMCLEGEFELKQLPPHMKELLSQTDIKESQFEYKNMSLKEAVEILEKKVILNAISSSNNNKTKAMELLGLSRRTFYRKLKDYNINCGEK